MNFPCPLSYKGLTSPRKKTQDLLHIWKAQRRDRRMLDKALIRGFYEPELVNAQGNFHSFTEFENSKEDSKGAFFHTI